MIVRPVIWHLANYPRPSNPRSAKKIFLSAESDRSLTNSGAKYRLLAKKAIAILWENKK